MHATEAAPSRGAAVQRSAGANGATRVVVSTFGALVAFAGLEHGVGEMLQGPVAPAALAVESWPKVEAFEILSGEPAMSVIPNLLVTGVLAVIVALTFGIWSVMFVERRYGGLGAESLTAVRAETATAELEFFVRRPLARRRPAGADPGPVSRDAMSARSGFLVILGEVQPDMVDVGSLFP